MIRPATPADAADIARVHVETWRTAYAGLIPPHVLDALSVPAGASRWEAHLADPAVRGWVGVAGGEVVAFASAGPPRDGDLGASHGEVYAVYVRPAAQRAGLGGALLEAASAWFVGEGRSAAALWVLAANAPARAFYAARGWRWDGSERDIDIGGAFVREARYGRIFPSGTATSAGFAR